jgi:hypothetical protein
MNETFFVNAPVIAEVDVLVCGGGPAGVGAAVAAARQGARTMLIEQAGCLGGVGTNALVGIWLGSYSRDGAFPVVGGLFNEIVERMVAEGGAARAAEDGFGSRHIGFARWHSRTIPFEYEVCKRVLDQLVLEAGVGLRLFTSFIAPEVAGGRIRGAFVYSKNGLEYVRAGVVVDATGDADVAARAGCPTTVGREEDALTSPATLIFVVEDVDYRAFESYCLTTGDVRLREIVKEIKAKGEWVFPFEIIICCEMLRRGRYFINTLRQSGIDGLKAEDLTRGMVEGRAGARQLFELMRRYVPGFANARLVQTAPVIGIRDTRRIVGDYRVAKLDIIEGRHFPDTIALSGYQWDMADPVRPSHQRMEGTVTSLPYAEIPYRSLVPHAGHAGPSQGVDNLIVAGRCISAEWDALGPLRVMPACFAMGQAAGTAAAMAAREQSDVRSVDVEALRASLLAQGVILKPEGMPV